jgi:hypothetical protein
MIKQLLFCLCSVILIFSNLQITAQVGINAGNMQPDPSAMLDVSSTTRGALLPRMTQSQISAISNPANGLQVFCLTDSKMYIYATTFGAWKELAYGTGTIAVVFSCGSSINVNHAAGPVSPVTKMVTYGTINSISGEPSKCWITSNLGSDHQASAVNDATEASAGWYWQFNCKQGYKMDDDGTTRTPNTTWIISISEDLDWQPANDPCSLELGTGWRVPSRIEWENLDVSGGWTSWTDPWNSGLMLHAAGNLKSTDGSLSSRGGVGAYGCSQQADLIRTSYLRFGNGYSYIESGYKSTGFSLRCIKDAI